MDAISLEAPLLPPSPPPRTRCAWACARATALLFAATAAALLVLIKATGWGVTPDLDITSSHGTSSRLDGTSSQLDSSQLDSAEPSMAAELSAALSSSLAISDASFALGAAFDGLQSVAKYVEEALQEYAASQDRKLGNDMLARAAQSHVDVMELLIAQGAEPSLSDKDGNTVDGATIVATFRNLAKGVDDEDAPKDEL